MRHLDEGTIHAWIDGASSAEESRGLEAHIATCESCAAMVAEARGLVAGASRILLGLDHVPAGVIPRGVPAAPLPGAGSPGVRRSRTRWWTRSAALRAAAVLLILGGGTVAVLEQTRGGPDVADRVDLLDLRESATSEAGPSGLESGEASDGERQSADGAGGAAGRSSSPASTGTSREREPEPVSDQPTVAAPRAEDAAAELRSGRAAAGAPDASPQAQAAAGRGIAEIPPRPAPGAIEQSGAPPSLRGRIGAASAGAPDTTVSGVGRAVADMAALQAPAVASAPPPAPLFEARRTGGDSLAVSRLSEVVTTGAQVAPGVALAGCYSIAVAPWIPAGEAGPRSPALPAVLLLEGTMLEVATDGPRLTLRVPGDTTAPSAAGSHWRIAGRDSLVLVWGATQPRTTIRLGADGPTRTGVAEHEGRRASVTAERIGDTCVFREGAPPR